MGQLAHNVVIGYWVLLNLAIVFGGVLGWVELRNAGGPRVVLYLSRVMLAEALRATITLVGIQRFHVSLGAVPVYVASSVFVSTLLAGAIWGWLLYTRGIINGGGVLGLVGRLLRKPERRIAMDNKKQQEQDKEAEEVETAEAEEDGDGGNGDGQKGVPDGPGE
jgi:hypothetical protein